MDQKRGLLDINHSRTVALICVGILAGFLGMASQQANGFGLGVFFVPIGWLLARHLSAMQARRRARCIAKLRALPWGEPGISDGVLVWECVLLVNGRTLTISRYLSANSINFQSDEHVAHVLRGVLVMTTEKSSSESDNGS